MRTEKILLVDDEPHMKKIMDAGLSSAGYNLFAVTSGEEALEVIAKIIPDLILLDIMMPGINGIELKKD